ncbi:MAG: ATP-dependent zinc protease [Desulfomonile tiedjei]|nr:ATP-dependent zinc protease [Desulfomonile tiedjei]
MKLFTTRREMEPDGYCARDGRRRAARSLWFSLLLLFVAALTSAVAAAEDPRPVVGVVEKVRIHPGALLLPAKIDTGADNSSLNAADVTRFNRAGEKWVRFDVVDPDGHSITLERKLVRTARIKRQTGQAQRRPVVMLGICLGNIYREVQVTLVDRSRFRYPVLIGRSFMSGSLLVDPSLKFTVEPRCPDTPAGGDERE